MAFARRGGSTAFTVLALRLASNAGCGRGARRPLRANELHVLLGGRWRALGAGGLYYGSVVCPCDTRRGCILKVLLGVGTVLGHVLPWPFGDAHVLRGCWVGRGRGRGGINFGGGPPELLEQLDDGLCTIAHICKLPGVGLCGRVLVVGLLDGGIAVGEAI